MKYLVYSHTRLDKDEIFYIGIGDIKRAYRKGSRNIHWKRIVNLTEYRVDILHDNLTWEQACEYEKKLIAKYGRRDLGKGPLVNMTDGGDGKVGYRFSQESKDKIGNSNKGKLVGEKNPFFGKKHSPELIKIIEEKKKLNPRIYTEEQKSKWRQKVLGMKMHDEDSINRISKNMPHSVPIKVWKKTGEYVGEWHAYSAFVREVFGFRARSETSKQYTTAVSKICGIVNGTSRNKTYKGYRFESIKNQ